MAVEVWELSDLQKQTDDEMGKKQRAEQKKKFSIAEKKPTQPKDRVISPQDLAWAKSIDKKPWPTLQEIHTQVEKDEAAREVVRKKIKLAPDLANTDSILSNIDESVAHLEKIDTAQAEADQTYDQRHNQDKAVAVAAAKFFANRQEIPLGKSDMEAIDQENADIRSLKKNKIYYDDLLKLRRGDDLATFMKYLSGLNYDQQKAVVPVLKKYLPLQKVKDGKMNMTVNWMDNWLRSYDGKLYQSLEKTAPKTPEKTGWWQKIKGVFGK